MIPLSHLVIPLILTTVLASPLDIRAAPANLSAAYIGCFADSSTRLLSSISNVSSSLTPQTCRTFCKSKGYTYAGVEYADECYCGNTYDTTKRQSTDSSCNMACAGEQTQTCGGGWAINVYKASDPSPSTSATTSTSSVAKPTSSVTSKPFTTATKSSTTTTTKTLATSSTTSTKPITASTTSKTSSTPTLTQNSTTSSTAAATTTSPKSSSNSTTSKTSITTSTTSHNLTSSTTTTRTSTTVTTQSSTISSPPMWSGVYHSFPTISPNPTISDPSYTRLSSLIPQVMRNSISISTHSWELGVLANALTEVFYPSYSPFSFDNAALPSGGKLGNTSPPWVVLDVINQTLSSYSWSGAPSNASSSTPLSSYLSYSTSPVALNGESLVNGDGALGDPCSLGPATLLAAEFFSVPAISTLYSSKLGTDYAWAVGNQYVHLESGTRDSQGALSQREGYFELWSDMGYMIPPFLAYLGLFTSSLTGSPDYLSDAFSQWALESNELMDWNKGLYLHIPDWDSRPWATGNGWMLGGFVRVLAVIQATSRTSGFSSLSDYEGTVTWVFYNLFGNIGTDGLIPNYMDGTGDSTGDASGSAMIAAAYYRFRVLVPAKASDWLDEQAAILFDAVVTDLGNDGWLSHVVNPEYPWTVYGGQSPEGQSAVGLMWASRTAAGI